MEQFCKLTSLNQTLEYLRVFVFLGLHTIERLITAKNLKKILVLVTAEQFFGITRNLLVRGFRENVAGRIRNICLLRVQLRIHLK